MQTINNLWVFTKIILLLIITTIAIYGGALLILPAAILGMAMIIYKLSKIEGNTN